MSYRYTGKRLAVYKARKSQECIYCPLKKPIAWPFIFLLFAFSPFIFSSPNLQKLSAAPVEPPIPQISQLRSQDVEKVVQESQIHTSTSAIPGK